MGALRRAETEIRSTWTILFPAVTQTRSRLKPPLTATQPAPSPVKSDSHTLRARLLSMNILLIGANSAIATAVARLYASDGHSLFLVGRDLAKLETLRDDLTVRGAGGVALVELDITHTARHTELIERTHTALGTS